MTVCPMEETFALYVAGDLARNDETSLQNHVSGCARCCEQLTAYRRLVDALKEDVGLGDDLVTSVLQRAAVQPAAAKRRFWKWTAWSAGAMGIVGAAAALVLTTSSRSTTEFAPRGSVTTPQSWVALRIYRRAGEAAPVPLSKTMHRDDALLVAYDNGGPEPFPYLSVYAVDATSRVHWLHPAWTDPQANPQSIRIEAGAARELREEIRHNLAPGRLRIYGLFTRHALSVRDIERVPGQVPAGGARVIVTVDVE